MTPELSASTDEPFFVVGASRSGTTLMRLILNAHPRLALPGETQFYVGVFEQYRRDGRWPEAVDAFITICEQRMEPAIELADMRRRLLDLDRPDLRALLDLPLRRWAAAEGKPRWGEKTPEHSFYSQPILAMFPAAKFVEMIRDPRAVVASMTGSRFKGDSTTRNALYWDYVTTTAHERLQRDAGAGQVISVRYEQLVSEPERTVREVCAFLGEEFDLGMLAFHEQTSSYMRAGRTRGDPRLMSPIGGEVDGWRAKLTDSQVRITEHVCAAGMRRFGYTRTGRSPQLSERAEIASNRVYVALKHLQHRDRYFHSFTGPVGTSLARVTSRLGLG